MAEWIPDLPAYFVTHTSGTNLNKSVTLIWLYVHAVALLLK